MNVLSIIPDPRLSGPHVRVRLMALELKKLGIETIVLTPPGPDHDFFRDDGIRVIHYELRRVRKRGFTRSVLMFGILLPKDVGAIARIVRREGISLVHCNGIMAVQCPIGAKLGGAKVLWHMNDQFVGRRVIRLVLGTAGRFADRIVYASFATARHCGADHADRGDVLYPPVGDEFFQHGNSGKRLLLEDGLSDNRKTIVSVGNVNAFKGLAYLVDGLAALVDRNVDVQCAVVGGLVDDVTCRSLERKVAEHRLEDRIKFVGRKTNVDEYLDAADLFIMPSEAEAMPICLVEAMAKSVPCIATDVGGVAEVIEDRISGLIVPSKNSSAIADAAEEILTDVDLEHTLRKNAKAVIQRQHTAAAIARHQARIYRELVP